MIVVVIVVGHIVHGVFSTIDHIFHTVDNTIDGIIEKIEQELGYPCTVVSTGGHAGIVIPYCKRKFIVDEKLLLKALMILYRKNS